MAEAKVMYGITTGFGKFSDVIIRHESLADLQLNLIRSHSVGIGEPFDDSRASH